MNETIFFLIGYGSGFLVFFILFTLYGYRFGKQKVVEKIVEVQKPYPLKLPEAIGLKYVDLRYFLSSFVRINYPEIYENFEPFITWRARNGGKFTNIHIKLIDRLK